MKAISKSSKGFTLIELVVAMAITSVFMAVIFAAYITQLRSHITQQQIVEMQQNLRAAMQLIQRDIRMAGHDPLRSAGGGITTMQAASLGLTMDVTGGEIDGIDNDNDGLVDAADVDENRFSDGDTDDANEQIIYSLIINGAGDQLLARDTGSGPQPVADFIEALNFVYLDNAGNPTAQPSQIKSVQVTIVARSGRQVPVLFLKQTDSLTYFNQQGQIILPAQNDNFRRIAVTADIKCRNL
jgi:type IV pilus assembly protein PilW